MSDTAQSFVSKPFDYLIVGGGTAGLVVAARLSEREDLRIGVLEAGHRIPEDLPAVSVPGRFGEALGTEYDWQFETVAQRQLQGRKLAWPRGKALGGTSALNFMTWNRPNREDLDSWQQLGCSGWGWDHMLPYFKKTEHFIEPTPALAKQHTIHYDSNVHGYGGPITVSFNKEYSALHKHWHKTLENLGIPINKSHMSGSNVGSFTSMVAVDPQRATREYSGPAYLGPAEKRPNLVVLTGANVENILIEKVDGEWTAKGVCFFYDGLTYDALALEEVILSAGSVQSPQILERSGVGNPSILREAGIEVKVPNKNVGENLQDHLMNATVYEVDESIPSPDDLRSDPQLASKADELYKTSLSGPRTLLACSFAYMPLSRVVSSKEMLSMGSMLTSNETARSRAFASRLDPTSRTGHVEFIFDVGNWNRNYINAPGKKYATLLQILQYPFSRGSIHIDRAEAAGPPVIDPMYYENEGQIDLEVQLHAARFGQKILETEPLKHFVGRRVWPPEKANEEELREWLVNNLITDWHPVGTCAMGRKEEEAVVDAKLRVHGVRRLRIVDASIMPLQISAHLQAMIYAIGEKGADMIIQDLISSRHSRL